MKLHKLQKYRFFYYHKNLLKIKKIINNVKKYFENLIKFTLKLYFADISKLSFLLIEYPNK